MIKRKVFFGPDHKIMGESLRRDVELLFEIGKSAWFMFDNRLEKARVNGYAHATYADRSVVEIIVDGELATPGTQIYTSRDALIEDLIFDGPEQFDEHEPAKKE